MLIRAGLCKKGKKSYFPICRKVFKKWTFLTCLPQTSFIKNALSLSRNKIVIYCSLNHFMHYKQQVYNIHHHYTLYRPGMDIFSAVKNIHLLVSWFIIIEFEKNKLGWNIWKQHIFNKNHITLREFFYWSFYWPSQ